MSCSGIHCAGCAGGSAVPALGLVALCGVDWVIENIIAVAVVSAVCGVLAFTAVAALIKWADRRDERHAASGMLLHVRAETVPSMATATATPQVSQGTVPAIEHHYHGPQFIINGTDGQDVAARLIRQALAVPAPEEIRP